MSENVWRRWLHRLLAPRGRQTVRRRMSRMHRFDFERLEDRTTPANLAPTIQVQGTFIAMPNVSGNDVSILRSDGQGGFNVTTAGLGGGQFPQAVAVGDLNNDGLEDIVTSNGGTEDISVLLANGSGGYNVSRYSIAGSAYDGAGETFQTQGVAIADLNGDGFPDIVATTLGDDTLSIFLNNGAGGFLPAFTTPRSFGLAFLRSVRVGDFNNDGNMDIAVGYVSPFMTVFFGDGHGGFTRRDYDLPSALESIAVGDVNHDGNLDIVGVTGSQLDTMLGDGKGDFTSTFTTVPAGANDVSLANLNGDQYLDVIASSGTNGVTALLANGSGGYTQTTYGIGNQFAIASAPVDVDGDGSQDIFVVNTSLGADPVFLNDGMGNFAPGAPVSARGTEIAVADTGGGSQGVDEDSTLIFDSLHGNAIELGDPDGGAGLETLSLSALHGTLTLSALSGLTIDAGSNGTSGLEVTGTLADLSSAVSGLLYHPNPNYNGSDTLSLQLDDDGNSGGDRLTATASVPIIVRSVNDAPSGTSGSVTMSEDGIHTFTRADFGFSDPADGNNFKAVKIDTLPTSGLFLDGGTAVAVGQFVSVADIEAGKLIYQPAHNVNGTASFTFQVQDDGGTALGGVDLDPTPKTLTVDIAAVNDAPTIAFQTIPDIVTANAGNDTTSFLLGNASGYSVTTLAGNPQFDAQYVAAGDLNNDGITDFVTAADGPTDLLAVYLGQGTGPVFRVHDVTVSNGGTSPTAITLADVNGDGNLDVILTDDSNNSVTVLLGDGAGDFSSQTTFGLVDGESPVAIAVGDIDGDGKLDLVTANQASSNLTILFGDGQGGFARTETVPLPANSDPVGVALGDFNSDGHLDIAVSQSGRTDVGILFGDGAGGFRTTTFNLNVSFGPTINQTAIAVADLDGDGHADIVVLDSDRNQVDVLSGDGRGDFSLENYDTGSSQFTSGFTFPESLTIADMNGDGLPDIVVSSISSNLVSVLTQENFAGSDFFISRAFRISGGQDPYSVAVGDFNDLQFALENGQYLFAAGQHNAITLADPDAGSGDETLTISSLHGSFTVGSLPSVTIDAVGSHSIELTGTLADLNRELNGLDYRGDTGYFGGDTITIVIDDDGSTGGAPLSATLRIPMNIQFVNSPPTGMDGSAAVAEAQSYSFAAADFGFSDPVDSNGFKAVKITTLPTAGGLVDAGIPVTAGQFIPVADINAQKLTYRASANSSGDASFTFQVEDDGGTNAGGIDLDPTPNTFTMHVRRVDKAPTIALLAPIEIGTANLDSENISVIGSDGAGGLAATTVDGGTPFAIASGDFNGDGRPDYVTADYFNGTATVFLSDGAGGFNVETLNVPYGPDAIAVGDINGDGHADIAVASYFEGSVAVLLGDGAGGFTREPDISVAGYHAGLALADINGDHKLDLVVPDSDGNTVQVLLGDGAGGFGKATTVGIGGGSGPYSVAVGDVNGDGLPDIVTVNRLSDNVSVLLADGHGSFAPRLVSNLGGGSGAISVALGDVNGDGNLDIVTADQSSDEVSVLLGDGVGNFAPSVVSTGAGSEPHGVAVTDVNGDGIADIVTANQSGDVSILTGDGSGGFALDRIGSDGAYGSYAVAVDDRSDTPSSFGLNEDSSLTFTGTGNALVLADADGGASSETATFAVSHGALTLGSTSGLSVSGNGSGSLVVEGTIAAIEAALNGLVYQPSPNFNGADTLTIGLDDNAGADIGGPLTASKDISITVLSVNDAPMGTDNTVSTNPNTPYAFATADFGFSDPSDVPSNRFLAVEISALPTTGSLVLGSTVATATPVVAGQFVSAADIAAGKLFFVPNSGSGVPSATFQFQVEDDGGTANGGVDLDPTARTMTIDLPTATALSIGRAIPTDATTNATTVAWEVQFSEPVSNLSSANFALTGTAGGGVIGNPTTSDGLDWLVPVTGIDSANGSLTLLLVNDLGLSSILINSNFPASPVVGDTYTLDHIAPTTGSLAVSTTVLSPSNAGSVGVLDSTTFTDTIADVSSVSWTLTIADSSGTAVRTFFGSGDAVSQTWDGKDAMGDFVLDGVYTATLTYQDAAGNAGNSVAASVTVDDTSPTATPLAASVLFLSPNNATSLGIDDSTTFTSTISDATAVSWTLTIVDASQNPVRTFSGTGSVNQPWDGRNANAAFVADGNYVATLTYSDAAGNPGIATSIPIVVDDVGPTASPLAVSASPFSPNNATSVGVTDSTTFSSSISDVSPVNWTVIVTNASNSVVRILAGTGPSVAATWDGKDQSSAFVSDGVYTATLVVSDAAGNTASTAAAVTVDDTTPVTSSLSASPSFISPNSPASVGVQDTTTLSATLADASAVSWTLTIASSSHLTVRTFTGTATAVTQIWDGKDPMGNIVADGLYTATLAVTDAAGNTTSTSVNVTVDDTPPTAAPLAVTNAVFAPNNVTSTKHTTTVTTTVTDATAVAWTLTITNSSNSVVRTFAGTSNSISQAWDGKDALGNIVADGTYAVTLTYVDAAGNPGASQAISVVIDNAGPALGALSTIAWTQGAANFSASMAITGGVAAYAIVSSSNVPPGLNVSLNGGSVRLAGTPTQAGTYSGSITIQDAAGDQITKTFVIVIDPPLAFGSATLPTYTVGVAYSQNLKTLVGTTGGTGTLSFSFAGSMPAGLTLNASTGVISGTPTAVATVTITVTVTDSVGATYSRQYVLTGGSRRGF